MFFLFFYKFFIHPASSFNYSGGNISIMAGIFLLKQRAQRDRF